MRYYHVSAATLALALAIGACGSAGSTQATSTGSAPEELTNEGGFGAPTQVAGEFDPTRTEYSVTGVLRLDNTGCWGVVINGTERLVVLPAGFLIDSSDANALVSGNGSTFRDGDAIDGTVRFSLAGDIPGGPAGRWYNYLQVCKPALEELAVFDDLAPAFDPTRLTSADYSDLLSSREFTEDWPCGRGWATSTADQRVGIVIYQIDDQQPIPDASLVLPDPGWTAEIIVGKHLFVNHCNDAIEEWMPEAIVVARFPLSGTIAIHDAVPAQAAPPSRVTATISGGTVDVNGTTLDLTAIELRNESYNAFAG